MKEIKILQISNCKIRFKNCIIGLADDNNIYIWNNKIGDWVFNFTANINFKYFFKIK